MATPPSASALQALTLFGLFVSSSVSSTPADAATITTGPLTSCVELLPVSTYAMAFGVVHTCGSRRRMKMWGSNFYGQLGREDAVILGGPGGTAANGATMKFIKGVGDKHVLTGCGGLHFTCVVLGDAADATSGDVKCFGRNANGELGVSRANLTLGSAPGDLENTPVVDLNGEKVTAMSCGYQATCALMASKEIKCWGFNQYGLAGVESSEEYITEMGADLKAVKLPGKQFTSVGAGLATCGSGPDGTFCWSYGFEGAAGNPTLGGIVGHSVGSMAVLANHPIDLGLNANEFVKKITTGTTQTCALVGSTETSRNRVKCWGGNAVGQLGYGDVRNRGELTTDMGTNLTFVDYGANKSVAQLAAGFRHICARFTDGTAACFGENILGPLGAETQVNLGSTPETVGAGTQYVKMGDKPIWDIVAAYEATAVIAGKYREIFAFGTNEWGQLGRVDVSKVGDAPGDMASLPAIEPGFCTVANFLEVPELNFESNFTTDSYYVYNPLPSTTVYVRVQADSAAVTSPDFDRAVEIGPGVRYRFSTYFNGGNASAPVTISGVYWCKYDEDVKAALPTLTVSPKALGNGTAPPALGNGTAPPTSSAVEVTFRLWGVALTAVLALLFL